MRLIKVEKWNVVSTFIYKHLPSSRNLIAGTQLGMITKKIVYLYTNFPFLTVTIYIDLMKLIKNEQCL